MSSLFLFKISAIIFHFWPAYILDFVTRLSGGRPILVRLHTNVWNSLKLLEKFIFTEWKFHNTKTQALIATLSEADKEKYNFDLKTLEWEPYFVNMAQGVRRYLSKEHPSSLDSARRKDKILLVLHLLLQAILYGTMWWLVSVVLGVSWTQSAIVVPILFVLFSFL